MKPIYKNTKAMRKRYNAFWCAKHSRLEEVYNSCSNAKRDAMAEAMFLCLDMSGDRFIIISHSVAYFTVGWLAMVDNQLSFVYKSKTLFEYCPVKDLH